MNLRDFVSTSLLEIANGISDTIKAADGQALKIRVNPVYADKEDDWERYQRDVEFDVAVTASEASTVEGKGEVKIWVLSAAGGGSEVVQSSTVSRIKFAIPILFPAHATNSKK